MPTTDLNTAVVDTTTKGLPTTMLAVAQRHYGTVKSLSVTEKTVPRPGAGEVLVAVHAAGVDRGVWHLVTGLPFAVRLAGFGILRPKQPIPGADLAGRVVAVGESVVRLSVGDEVYGTGTGAFAQYAVAAEDNLALKPASLSFVEAAALPTSGTTALQALLEVGRVEAGQRVLVMGASGGVGSFAVQLARAAGAEVTGVSSASKHGLVRELGASHVVDYATTDVTTQGLQYDLIIDIGGRTKVSRLRRILTPRGTLVIVGGEGGGRFLGGAGRQFRASAISPLLRQRLTTFISMPARTRLEALDALVRAGDICARVGATYALEQAGSALADLQSGKASGKSVIAISTDA